MSVVYKSDDLPVASRADYWQHIVGDTVVPLELRIGAGLDVQDRLLVGDMGPVRVAELVASKPGGARRTARLIRRSDPDLCKIDVNVHGQGVIEQDGRQAHLTPGDFALVDLSRPATWTLSAVRAVAVIFPRALLPLGPDELARLTAVRIPGNQGAGALISSLARQLTGHLDDVATAGTRLGSAVLDLLTVALAARLDRRELVSPETRQRALLRHVQAHIEERLGDPDLSPGEIAAAHHVSVRYLYKVFETQQTSVAGWIRARRLERCRRDLLDPTLQVRPVSAIAARWGLTNAAHFSRAFRAAYGVPPVEYRAMVNRSRPSAS
jgi:AraC-like DNA-binding protein